MDPVTILLILLILVGIGCVIAAGVRRNAKVQRGELVLVEKTNTLAVLSFVLSFFLSVAAIVLGHIAVSQINRTHERGWGLAAAGLTLGYIGVVVGALAALIFYQTATAYGF
ncbi:DUF4190 domain-containing protein [Leucobacter ruminantium]|uniref:DUF4190 domain-containing protein n=1 Tax=Leucobacter ruminantium TaxID=1289170 RepID=A0A939RU30_9MICO|nr:DUF4190 domain-containing protein [Leucobacter ruminantium]MBO1805220.1 DUF4190 domain-containing protein [Leucobacter ruminantium]